MNEVALVRTVLARSDVFAGNGWVKVKTVFSSFAVRIVGASGLFLVFDLNFGLNLLELFLPKLRFHVINLFWLVLFERGLTLSS